VPRRLTAALAGLLVSAAAFAGTYTAARADGPAPVHVPEPPAAQPLGATPALPAPVALALPATKRELDRVLDYRATQRARAKRRARRAQQRTVTPTPAPRRTSTPAAPRRNTVTPTTPTPPQRTAPAPVRAPAPTPRPAPRPRPTPPPQAFDDSG
jgi:peptidoglycan DL-endopeptidase CwlO